MEHRKVYLVMLDDFYSGVTRVERVFGSKNKAAEYLRKLHSTCSEALYIDERELID